MSDIIVDIAVPVAVSKTFHYIAPDDIAPRIIRGARVMVPFGTRRVIGTVIGFPRIPVYFDLKPIFDVLDDTIPPGLLSLAEWMAEYYINPLGLTIDAMVPKAVSRLKPRKAKYIILTKSAPDGLMPKGARQRELLRLLIEAGRLRLDRLKGFSAGTIKALQEAGMIEIVEDDPSPAAPAGPSFEPDEPPPLQPEQKEAVQKICAALDRHGFEPFLLHGVTGSGKTEVYLQVISRLAGSGKGAIVLVPEISLTPQLLGRFRRRFGERVAVLHSRLTDRGRADEYRRIKRGEVDVVVGARSAVFAPFERLGAIIVDEEHEGSYKQDDGLRYHARDVAIMRAKIEGAVAVLGSATPSLESFFNAKTGKYTYLKISNRIDHRSMPSVSVVDMRTLPKAVLSQRLIEAVRTRMERGEQAMLMLNRRGFSPVLVCRDCGSVPRCPSCSVSLAYHKADRLLKCHYCDFYTSAPDICPSCFGASVKPLGAGTQRIEEEIRAAFPASRIARMDSDSIKGRAAYDELLSLVDSGRIDILLGTQMIAKGHDFPSVTLVGIVDADIGLNLPDFRAAEKSFQLITQAAGRAGRGGVAGEVIIQTLNPDHYAVRHSLTHDYEGFYEQEMTYRTQLGYPPVGKMVKIETSAPDEKIAREAIEAAKERMQGMAKSGEVALLGPAPSPITRVRGRYRYQILLISGRRGLMRSMAVEGRTAVEENFGRRVRIIIDVDPVNLM